MRSTTTILFATMAALTLSGCQLFNPGHGSSLRSAQATPDMSSYFDQRLADGRRHLRAGRLASAITAYRQASYSADHTATAYNGLAIAYDRLGRADLARMYFEGALERAPENLAIARNLARFAARQPTHDEAEGTALASFLDEEFELSIDQQALAAAAESPMPAVQADETTADRLVRVNNRELQIRAREDMPSRLAAVAEERAAVIHVGRPSGAQVAVEEQGSQYPVRVQLGSAPNETRTRVILRRGPPNGRSYPVRVSLPTG